MARKVDVNDENCPFVEQVQELLGGADFKTALNAIIKLGAPLVIERLRGFSSSPVQPESKPEPPKTIEPASIQQPTPTPKKGRMNQL